MVIHSDEIMDHGNAEDGMFVCVGGEIELVC